MFLIPIDSDDIVVVRLPPDPAKPVPFANDSPDFENPFALKNRDLKNGLHQNKLSGSTYSGGKQKSEQQVLTQVLDNYARICRQIVPGRNRRNHNHVKGFNHGHTKTNDSTDNYENTIENEKKIKLSGIPKSFQVNKTKSGLPLPETHAWEKYKKNHHFPSNQTVLVSQYD